MALRPQRLRFPRPGLPLLARSLRPLFHARISHSLLSDGALQTAVGELHSGVWAYRTPAECKMIAKVLSRRLTNMYVNDSPRFADVHVPALDPPRRVEDLPLSEMLLESLQRCGFADTQQLASRRVCDLMDLPQFGARRVLELLAVLDSLGPNTEPSLPPSVVDVAPATAEDLAQLKELETLLGTDDIQANDVRFGEIIAHLRTGKPTLRSALESLKCGASSWSSVRSVLARLSARLGQVRGFNLSQDLVDVLHALTSTRKADMVARRLGWYDGQERTLQEVGDAIGLTRERVRQVEARTQQKLQSRSVFAPALLNALALAKRMTPCTAAVFAEALKNSGLTETVWNPGNLVRAAGYLGIPHGLMLQDIDGTEFLAGDSLTPEIFARARRLAWSASRIEGAAQLSRVAMALSEELERRVSIAEMRSIISALTETRWIDEPAGWFWFGDDGHTAIFNTVRKLLSVARRLPIDDLYEGLLRSYRMDDTEVAPKSVLLKVFGQVSWLSIRQSSHVVAVEPLNWEEVLAEGERLMVQVLKEAGNVLDLHDFRRRCLERGMIINTFLVYISNSPLFVRIAPSVWGMRGVDFDPRRLVQVTDKIAERQLRRAIAASEKRVALLDAAARERVGNNEHHMWLYRVTASAFRNYIATFARLRALPVGSKLKVILDSQPLGEVHTTSDQRLIGFIKLLRNAGVQPDQAFIAQFDLSLSEIRLDRVAEST